MDPYIELPGYKPPTSAEELLERYAKGERYFGGASVSGANLSNSNLLRVKFDGADLSECDIRGSNLRGSSFNRANMRKADLSGARLSGVDLTNANLFKADLSSADLSGAYACGTAFAKANLTGTNLRGAAIKRAGLRLADLATSRMGWTVLVCVGLGDALGLSAVCHEGPSSIGLDTLRLSKGRIPSLFLRGCVLADWEIKSAGLYDPDLPRDQATTLLHEVEKLRIGAALQLNPLFVSYCHADAQFVDAVGRLLDGTGIRYWRDTHDATAGQLERQIDRALRLNPTVLLVLSRHSVLSDWVEWEASRARSIEKELGHDVLCPIALDDSWKTCVWPGPLRQQITKYNILDFSGWQDKATMERQFRKLVDGLALFYMPEKQGD